MGNVNYNQLAVIEKATELTDKGYTVYVQLSDHYNYAFYTDGARCVYFQYDTLQGYSYTTCMVPSRESGTGWALNTTRNYKAMLYPSIPNWARSSGKFLTPEQYLTKNPNYKLFTKSACNGC